MSGVLVAVRAPTYAIVAVVVFVLGRHRVRGAVRYWRRRQPAPSPEAVTTVIDEPPADKHVRTPSDVLHLIVGVLLVLLGLLVATGASNTLVGLERDLIELFDALPETLASVIYLFFQGIASLIPAGVGLVVLWRRRFRLFGMLILAALVAQSLTSVLNDLIVKNLGTPELLAAVHRPEWLKEAATFGEISSTFVAGMVSTVVLGSPWVNRAWRRVGWAVVVISIVFRIAAAQAGPLDIVVALGAGIVGGSAILLIFGAPNKRPRGPAVVAAMARAGVPLAQLTRAGVDARSSTPYFADADDGQSLFIKVLGRDERSADLMFRIYRFLRLKDVGDRGPFSSLQRMVEHEALVALYANDVGILTPRLVASANVGDEGFLLAYERTAGDSLDRVDDEAISDDVLRSIWQGVETMRTHRIAHRDLRLANVMLAPDGRPWMIDFGFAEIAATDQMLDTDVAELLSSTALKVGVTRAVDAALAVIGKPAVAQRRPAHPAAGAEYGDAQVPGGAQAALRRTSQVRRRGQRGRQRRASGPAAHQVADVARLRVAGDRLLPAHPATRRRQRRVVQAEGGGLDVGAVRLGRLGADLRGRDDDHHRRRACAHPLPRHLRHAAWRLFRQPHRAGPRGWHRHQRALLAEAGHRAGGGLVECRPATALGPAHAHHPLLPLPGVGGPRRRERLRLPALEPDGAHRPHRGPGPLRASVPAAGRAPRAAQTRHADTEALRTWHRRGGAPAVQGGRALRRVACF